MSVPLRPLGDRVLIKADVEDHAPEATASGLTIAKTMAAAVEGADREDSWFVGTIVACGPQVNDPNLKPRPDPLHVGDRVTFSWATGQQVKVGDERFIIMRSKDVLAVLEAV